MHSNVSEIDPILSSEHHMWVPSADMVKSIVQRFGTPTYVYDSEFLERHFRALRQRIDKNVDIFYSLKANPNISVTKALHNQGAGAEVSSLVELHTALRAGVAPRDVIFVGPAKSVEELSACLRHRIFAIVCESIDEIAEIDRMARETGQADRRVPIMIRVNPEFSGAGSGLAMSGKPRQFGIDEARIRAEAARIRQFGRVDLLGFHVYMGTRYLDPAAIIKNTENITRTMESLARELDIPLRAIDIGGGLGVPYFENESALDMSKLSAGVNDIVRRFRGRHPEARVIMELGRFLVAGCGVMLTKVRYIKDSMGETFAIADGGTNLHMAAVGIGSFVKRNFPVKNFSAISNDNGTYTVTGPLCTPNDTLAKRARLRRVREGDVLGVLYSGAYGPTASPTQFLSHGYPAEVMVIDGEAHLVRQRETLEDILGRQVLVSKTP